MGLIDWARNLFGFGKLNRKTTPAGTVEKEFGVRPAASRQMEGNINLWWNLYTDNPPWETDCIRPLGLPSAIGRELARNTMTEFSVSVSGSARAEYINRQVQVAANKFGINLERCLCLGGVALKPYQEGSRILVEEFTTGFAPTHFDGADKCIGGVFKSAPARQGNEWFIRLEYHDFLPREDGSTIYVIENKAFRSGQDGGIGAQVSLSTVNEWAQLLEHVEIEGLEGPLFAYFKPPVANNVEPDSKMGLSVYAGATVDLIKQADEMWERLLWEFRSGERKIFADDVADDAHLNDRIFVFGPFSGGKGDFFQPFSPEFRDDPLYRGFQRILQRIEYNAGLAYGTLSDPQSVEKTATEILTAKQRQYVTCQNIQKAFQAVQDGLIYAMDALCDLGKLAAAGTYTVDYNWGDGVLDDPDTKRQDMAIDMQRVNNLLMSRKQFIMKWEGVDEETAQKILSEIDDMNEIVTEPQEEIE